MTQYSQLIFSGQVWKITLMFTLSSLAEQRILFSIKTFNTDNTAELVSCEGLKKSTGIMIKFLEGSLHIVF